jgi:hypothetical protein
MSTFVHHGLIFVPLGYAHAFKQLTDLSEVHGGSPWGAGSYANTDGSRQPTALELEIAQIQGTDICGIVINFTDAYTPRQDLLHHTQEVGTARLSGLVPAPSSHLTSLNQY